MLWEKHCRHGNTHGGKNILGGEKVYWPEKKLHSEGKIYLAWEKDTERVKQRIRKKERNMDKNKGRYQIERQSMGGGGK